jgi:WD40 repeat protein
MSFGFNCSQGALKSIAVSSSGLYLSCGGTDERIRLFNVAENRSMGELGLHEGAITALEFFEDSHMISGSDVRPLKLLYIAIAPSSEYGSICNIVCTKIPNMEGYDAENLAMS